jgi:hypothetical protein
VFRSTRRLPLPISVPSADSVQFLSRLPDARTIGLLVGATRLTIGAAFLAAPVASVRLMGVDSATAARVSWLARMTAARDGVLGAGTMASSARRSGAVGWLLAGAVSDAADAAVLVAALRQGKLGGWRAQAISAAAVGAAVVAAAAALDVRRHG